MAENNSGEWRHNIDALVFEPEGHQSVCMVHRMAFRTLLQFIPTPEDCIASSLNAGLNFHLTSRDLPQALMVAK
jgi:hypothetical protein